MRSVQEQFDVLRAELGTPGVTAAVLLPDGTRSVADGLADIAAEVPMLPVVIDALQPYSLARLGVPAPIVLTPRLRRSPIVRYRIPRRRLGEPRRWLKVVLRARVELAGDHGDRGFGAVSLLTHDRASASAEFGPVRRDGKTQTRWTGAALHGGKEVVTDKRVFRVAFTNYARVQGSSPGVHTLGFRLRIDAGLRVRRVVVSSRSGLFLTHQPPQAITASAVVTPAEPEAGQPFAIRFTVRNRGAKPTGPVVFAPLLPGAVSLAGPAARIAGIARGAQRSADLHLVASADGDYRIETLARSRVGQDVAVVNVHVSAAPAVTTRRRPSDRREDAGDGLRPAVVWPAIVGVAGLGAAGVGARRARRRR